MNYLSAENLSKSYSEKWLFREITFGISQGDKIALVGANGTGKSTLLKVLAGLIAPDTGNLSIRDGVKRGYLSQEPDFDPSQTVWDCIFGMEDATMIAIREYEQAIEDPETTPERMQEVLDKMDDLKAWDYESKVKMILGRLGISNLEQLAGSLSGGQRKRVAMARLLLSSPDLLILDEPTNHLDLEAIEWLENYLASQNITVIMVTHDRYFLDNVTKEIIELEKGKMYKYKGNYAYFLEKKAEREASTRASVDKAKNQLVKELEWMRRQPKARGTKAKYRIEAFHELKEKASQNLEKSTLQINVKMARQGGKIIEAKNISKSFGEKKIVEDFSYIFTKQERIGIVGKNGLGKSTFLDLLTEAIAPDSGRIEMGETTKIGYYTQESDDLHNENRLIEEVKEIAEYITLGTGEVISVSRFLEMFLFPPAMQYSPVSLLSGGERRRLQLLKVLVGSPNFLILDEPTNDLDIDTLNVLEEYLSNFNGCLMLVSHDRYFMDRLVDHLFIFEGEGIIRDYPGNYSDYRSEKDQKDQKSLAEPSPKAKVQPVAPAPAPEKEKKQKLSYKEQKELESLGTEIEKLEKRKTELTQKLTDSKAAHQDLLDWSLEIEKIANDLDAKTMRWLELSEMA